MVSRRILDFGEGHILGDRLVEMVADHQHVQMLFQRVDGVGHGRVGGTGDHVLAGHDLDDVGRVAAARAFGVEGVDGAARDGLERVLDEAALVQRVGMDHHLHVHRVGHGQAAVDGAGRGPPVLVQFQRAGAGAHLFLQRLGQAGIALAREGEVHREGIGGLHHPHQVPRAGGAGGGERAVRGAGAAAEHRGKAGVKRVVDLLRADEMDVRVHAARRQDAPLACDDLGSRADDDVDIGLGVGVSGLADLQDAPVAQADICLVDAGMVEDQRVGNDRVRGAPGAADLALAHAVADHLAATEFHLFPVGCEIMFNLDDKVRVAQAHPVAGRGAVHVGIGGAGNEGGHGRLRVSGGN